MLSPCGPYRSGTEGSHGHRFSSCPKTSGHGLGMLSGPGALPQHGRHWLPPTVAQDVMESGVAPPAVAMAVFAPARGAHEHGRAERCRPWRCTSAKSSSCRASPSGSATMVAVDDARPRRPARRVLLRCSVPQRLRQDHDAADARRVRAARRGHIRSSGRVRAGRPALQARRQHGVPELRPVPAHDGRRERRIRPAPEPRRRSARSRSGSARRSTWSR